MSFTARTSFKQTVDVRRSDGGCSLKRHFKLAMREVIGRLDMLADLDTTGERFVFEQQLHTALKTFHWSDGKRERTLDYRTIKRIIAFLREKGVVSERLMRDREGLRWGYIIAPHEALCVIDGQKCRFVGAMSGQGTSGTWVRWQGHYGLGDPEPDWDSSASFWAPKGWLPSDGVSKVQPKKRIKK